MNRPDPAEAATEIGADDAPGEHSAWYWLEEFVVGAALVAFVAFLIIVVGAA